MTNSANTPSAAGAGSTISASTAQLLINTYKTEEGWTPDKTRAVWFSQMDLDTIQGLINNAGGDGIRIYFGKYPLDIDIPGTPDPAYKGKVTLVWIPTVAAADGSHQDLFPPLPQTGEIAGDTDAYNHGELCPPNCPPPPPTQA